LFAEITLKRNKQRLAQYKEESASFLSFTGALTELMQHITKEEHILQIFYFFKSIFNV